MSLIFRMSITADNAAFDDFARDQELARILRDVATRLEQGECNGYDKYLNVRDINGNIVGTFRLKEEE